MLCGIYDWVEIIVGSSNSHVATPNLSSVLLIFKERRIGVISHYVVKKKCVVEGCYFCDSQPLAGRRKMLLVQLPIT